MATIFLSYSRQDYFFAEMLGIKLQSEGFKLWRDLGSIRAGDDWRQTIEDGIEECVAVVVALSATSAESAYVTYEWAYALGMSKPVIPVVLSECKVHLRLEPIQHIDFSYPKSLPWTELIARLREVEVEKAPAVKSSIRPASEVANTSSYDETAKDVLAYLNSKGFTMASFDRLREKIDSKLTDEAFNDLIAKKPTVFRHAMLKGRKRGIANRVP
ncbi:MAG: toll/interleukin-1 receptor domain-containing protein [Nitrospira sp.]|nr:toll/interleukin-1 receptor domain-containing protein [Nitrospira sp.]